MASKSTGNDEPGAFEAREWLRKLVVGKPVRFETRKQGASAGDRVYGWLFLDQTGGAGGGGEPLHLAVECVRQGFATPKAAKFPNSKPADDNAGAEETDENDYEAQLMKAYKEAEDAKRGIHAPAPMVRPTKNAGEEFQTLTLVEACQKHASQKRLTCVIEYIFDGSRFRCQVTDPQLPDFQYASFTLLLGGVTCPRIGNPKADPPIPQEPFSEEARQFVTARLLQRELQVSLLGTDKNGINAVGTVHHPAGNIALELLKNGLARMTDWSVRMMPAGEVPALRVAENTAKRTLIGIWHAYAPPVLMSASQIRGTVVEVISGDTLAVLPEGKAYESEEVLMKISLASIRAPRIGSERAGRPDEPYSNECKDKLRVMTIGKTVEIDIHYERDIPIRPGEVEKRPFGTVSVGKHADVSEVLISEGLAVTQHHRDDDEKSPRYDDLLAAEAVAKAANKGVHKKEEYKKAAVNDLTVPHKAKAYSGSLMRAGKIKASVDYVFNGALFKLFVPAENCYIRFSPAYTRCPQPSPNPGSKQGKPAEPFGDAAKNFARLNVLQRSVEITCNGVTNGGILTGSMYIGQGSNRQDYTIELLGAGFASLDERKVEYNEVPKPLLDAQANAQASKVGIWTLEQPKADNVKVKVVEKCDPGTEKGQLCEIRSGNHLFYHVSGDEALKVMDDSMKTFTKTNGLAGGPCDVKIGKVVAALFDDGTGKRWYRAKIVERKGPGKVAVLFVDYGNISTVPVASHLRPLDLSLGIDRIPPVAKEAVLALTVTRSLETDEGVNAARMLQGQCWGKELTIQTFAPDENGKMAVAITAEGSDESINVQLVTDGLARAAKQTAVDLLTSRLVDSNSLVKLAADLKVAEEAARKSRSGMWRYGDVGDEDPDEL